MSSNKVKTAGTITRVSAVEVISPGDTYLEVEDKAILWLEAGCRMVLTVNPRNRTVTVYRSLQEIVLLTDADTIDLSDMAPNWSILVRDLFR